MDNDQARAEWQVESNGSHPYSLGISGLFWLVWLLSQLHPEKARWFHNLAIVLILCPWASVCFAFA